MGDEFPQWPRASAKLPGVMRLVFTDPAANQFHPVLTPSPGDHWPDHPVVAVIGPFDNHLGQRELQNRLKAVVRQWNAEQVTASPESAPIKPQDEPNPSSRGEREGLRDRIAREIDSWAFNVTHTGKPWEDRRQRALDTADRVCALLPTDPEPVNGELVEAAKEALGYVQFLSECGAMLPEHYVQGDERAWYEIKPDYIWNARGVRDRLRTALSRAESLQGKGG